MNLVTIVTNPANVVAALAAGVAFATMVTLAAPMLRQDTLEVRLKSVATRREELRRKSREAMAGASESLLRRKDEGRLQDHRGPAAAVAGCWRIRRSWTSSPRPASGARGR